MIRIVMGALTCQPQPKIYTLKIEQIKQKISFISSDGMGVTRKFSRGEGIQPLVQTTFMGPKPIHIKESSGPGGEGAPPRHP